MKTPVSPGHILEKQGMRAVWIKKAKFKDETHKHRASFKLLEWENARKS